MKRKQLKLQRKRLSDQVIEELIARITSGELQAGDKLPPEPQLMEQFGVGRSSIREAIGALELLGLLSVRPGQGTRITDATDTPRSIGLSLITMGREKIRELVEARTELEQIIARFAAERATEDDIAEIKKQHKKLIQAQKNGAKLITADMEFHTAVASACHNTVFIRFFSELHQPIRHWMQQKAKYDWGFDRVVEEHEAILHAIEAHDADAAQAAMQQHIEAAGGKLAYAMQEIDANTKVE
ncbi:MAG: FadR/GntR family transcriptional regulator [Desulfovibrionaceae bacterium]